jgi:secondary thiamine-phosphate synthase enzyme
MKGEIMECNNFTVKTGGRTDFVDITARVAEAVAESGLEEGLCVVYVPHTTAGVTINESADPAVRVDIADVLARVVPWEGGYAHAEGNSAAHVKASLMGSSATVLVEGGSLVLGTWQGIFFCDFDGPRTRTVQVRLLAG